MISRFKKQVDLPKIQRLAYFLIIEAILLYTLCFLTFNRPQDPAPSLEEILKKRYGLDAMDH